MDRAQETRLTIAVAPGFATAGSKATKKKGKKGAAMTFEPEPESEPVVVVPEPEPEKKDEDDMWGSEYSQTTLSER